MMPPNSKRKLQLERESLKFAGREGREIVPIAPFLRSSRCTRISYIRGGVAYKIVVQR